MPTPGTSLEDLDRAIDAVIARVADNAIDGADLKRARTRLVADAIYAQDNQASLARWYGASLATGLTIEDITRWPERIEAVTADDVQKAARKWLDKRRAVTGFLLPEAAA
jgi:zinc protease